VSAAITEGGRGILFGVDHAFSVAAKPGWVLDNQSGAKQGLHMLFYPKGETWSNSSVIIYGRAVPSAMSPDIETHAVKTVREFKENGSPMYKSERRLPLTLPDGQKAEFYFYSGDQWGNYEAAAYFQEADTINYLVFNSRTKDNFDKYLDDFKKIVSTYQNLFRPAKTVTKEQLNILKNESDAYLNRPGGKEYEAKAIQAIGEKMAFVMKNCTANTRTEEQRAFNYVVEINHKGDVVESSIFPANVLSKCFSGLMSDASYPGHEFASFLLSVEMKLTP
jgi:hypothetical protein